MVMLYLRKTCLDGYYMATNDDQPLYFRDGFPELVVQYPSIFCSISDAAMAAAQAGYLVHIDLDMLS